MQRLKKIFVRAGGVQRATDLVEYYEAVGYAHFLLYSIQVQLELGTVLPV